MPRGGKRPGAGRKKGAATRRTREAADKLAAEGTTPLEVLVGMMTGAKPFDEARYKCAVAAAPYMHPRLSAIEHTGKDGGPIETVDYSALSDEQLATLEELAATAGAAGPTRH